MRRAAALVIGTALLWPAPVRAIIEGAEERDPAGLRTGVVALDLGGRTICSGVLIAPDLVLTAAHCLAGGRPARAMGLDAAFRRKGWRVVATEAHPAFISGVPPADQTGVDLALLRLETPTGPAFEPLGLDGTMSAEPERLALAGFGASQVDGGGDRRLRAARGFKPLPAFGAARLFVDATTDGARTGRAACHGDSGGPLLGPSAEGRLAVAGIVSWTSGPLNRREAACGGLTAVVPVAPHTAWIEASAARLGRR